MAKESSHAAMAVKVGSIVLGAALIVLGIIITKINGVAETADAAENVGIVNTVTIEAIKDDIGQLRVGQSEASMERKEILKAINNLK